MTRFIVLTKHQAAAIRGETVEGHKLDPMPLADGETFVLPETVLHDPAHTYRHVGLRKKLCREVGPEEWPAGEGA